MNSQLKLRPEFALPVLLFLTCFAGRIHAQSPTNYDQVIKEARALITEGRWEEAKAKTTEAAKMDPTRFEAHSAAAIIAIRQNDTATAKNQIEKAIALAPVEKKASLEALRTQLNQLEPPGNAPREAGPAFPGKSLATVISGREAAVAWFLSSTSIGQHLTRKVDDAIASNSDRTWLIGKGLVKSRQPVWLEWRYGELFSFELEDGDRGWFVADHDSMATVEHGPTEVVRDPAVFLEALIWNDRRQASVNRTDAPPRPSKPPRIQGDG